jgi:hypothetical protein
MRLTKQTFQRAGDQQLFDIQRIGPCLGSFRVGLCQVSLLDLAIGKIQINL